MTTDLDLTALAQTAVRAANIQADLDAAAAMAAAEASALAAIIAAARPALRSIAQRIVTTEKSWWVGNTHTDSEKTYYEKRGVYLPYSPGNKPGPDRRKDRSGTSGSYEGTDLFLLTDGTLLALTYDGSWSDWQGSGSEFTGEAAIISTEDAVRCHDVATPERVADALSRAITSVINGNARERTEKMRERAGRLDAVARLL